MRKIKDLWGVYMAAGVGVITGMIYYVGKLSGKGEAYGECSNMLQECIADVMTESDEDE